jgi:hypothetical protein
MYPTIECVYVIRVTFTGYFKNWLTPAATEVPFKQVTSGKNLANHSEKLHCKVAQSSEVRPLNRITLTVSSN